MKDGGVLVRLTPMKEGGKERQFLFGVLVNGQSNSGIRGHRNYRREGGTKNRDRVGGE